MPTKLPRSRLKRLEHYENQYDRWLRFQRVIGVSDDDLARMRAKLDAARAAYTAMGIARTASQSATAMWYAAEDEMSYFGSALNQTVRVYASRRDDPRINAMANVPPRSPNTERPAPPTPERVQGRVLNTGSIEISWRPPSGGFGEAVHFQIERQVIRNNRVLDWAQVGFVGRTRRFIDDTLPTGITEAMYRVTAVYADKRSDSSQAIVVRFGSGQPKHRAGVQALAA